MIKYNNLYNRVEKLIKRYGGLRTNAKSDNSYQEALGKKSA